MDQLGCLDVDDGDDFERGVEAVAFLPGYLFEDALLDQSLDKLSRPSMRQSQCVLHAASAEHRAFEQQVDEAQQVVRRARRQDRLSILVPEIEETIGTRDRIGRLLGDATEEKLDPLDPCSALADVEQMITVLVLMSVQVIAEIQQRLYEELALAKQQGDEQSPYAAVSIHKWIKASCTKNGSSASGEAMYRSKS